MALTTFVAGQVLTAAQLNDSYAAVDWNENVIINGAMQVAQRGTSTASITASGYYTADRFNTNLTTLGTWTQSVENDAPTGSGFRKSLKMLCTTADAAPAASDLVRIDQYVEGQNVQLFKKGTADAKTFVLSFWVKSNVTGTFVAELSDVDNTRQVSATYTISASATWEKKTITFPADTTGAFDNDNGSSLSVNFPLGAGSNFTSGTLNTVWASTTNANRYVGQTNVAATLNNYWQITGVQLQPERASQFLFEDYGTVLAQCQRYYVMWANGDQLTIANASYFGTTSAYGVIQFPVAMRTAPSMTSTSGTNYFAFSVSGASDLFNSIESIIRPTTISAVIGSSSNLSGTAGQAGNFLSNNASAQLSFSSEL